jgi:RHS repeat-associated protein
MLTVRQTDLRVPGRGIDLDFTRVYAEPYRFLGGAPYGYDNFPWAPMGNGWQLNFPWMLGSSNPTFIHLWDGEGYRIPTVFWSGATAIYENHQGENFRLSRGLDGSVALSTASGLSYNFDGTHRLANITDTTGLNRITFSYDGNNHISKIIDTVGRVFIFCYTNSLVHSINQTQTTGTCTSSGSIRGLVFTYNGSNDLVNASDPAGRVTSYSYDSTFWLITRITYPPTWYDAYSYTTFVSGTQANIYRVYLQRVNATNGIPVRSFKYSYTEGTGDQVNNSTVTTYDRGGTLPVSYTSYAFSFAGIAWNISDSNHSLMRGELQRFNAHGQVSADTVIVTDRSGLNWPAGSYTNYYSYDLWGNQIYSRRTIFAQPTQPYDPAQWYHETFTSYYNDGLQPGFNTFQDTFSTEQGTLPDNFWNATNGHWLANNGVYNGTETNGKQESMFSWYNIGMSDISIQARVYVNRKVNASDQRIGLITHYTGSGFNKWALVLHNSTNGIKLSLLDENVAWVVENPCTLVYNTWYTFNFTTHGNTATGWATAPGVGTCTVAGTFPSDSVLNATSFGLYSGGYSALFDNVTATTVSPAITGPGLSNPFINNGAPNGNIHSAIAGTAQLQNGTGTQPIETYYSYTPWGGLNQTRTRYDPSLIDGSSESSCQTTNSCSVIFSSKRQNDIVIVYTLSKSPFTCTFSVTDAAGLNWAARAGIIYGGSYEIEEFWAKTLGVLNVDKITESISGCGFTTNGIQAFAINGANFANPFDPNIFVPRDGSGTTATGPSVTIQTSDSNDVIIAGAQFDGGSLTPGAGFTPINSSFPIFVAAAEYELVNSAVSNFFVTFTSNGGNIIWEEVTDAVQLATGVSTQWLTTTRSYDTYGNIVNVVDARGNSTSYSYSSKYQNAFMTSKTQILNPGSTQITSSYGYNFTTGTRVWSQEPDGYGTAQYNTTYKYDILDRVTKITYPTGDYTNYTYNDRSNYVEVTNENGWHTRQVYDGLSRLSVNEKFLGTSTFNETYAYNWQDKIVTQTDQLGHVYTNQYDPLGRLTQTTEPNGNFTQIIYNDVRGWVKHIDENNLGPASWTFYTYDRTDRLIETDDPPTSGANSALYFYDEVGNLRRTCFVSSQFSCGQPGSQPTVYAYDNVNRLIKTLYPDNTIELYGYDNTGNIVQKTDKNGVQANLSYDSMNRVSFIQYSDPASSFVSFSYDKDGNVLSIFGTSATINYQYDSRARVVSENYQAGVGTNNANYVVRFYYSGETLSQISYPDGLLVNYTYDSLGRVINVFKAGGASNYASFYYYATDQVKSVTYGNSSYANYTYESLNRPATITVTQPGKKGSTTLLSLTYSYNKTGTVAQVNGQVNGISENEQYKYDSLRRLTNATLTKGSSQTTLSYQYDSLGNRVWQKLNSTATSFSYNAYNNELVSSTSGSATTAYSYDPDGNLLTKNVTSGGTVHWRYTWSVPSYLSQASNDNGVQGTYVYDAAGRMVGSKEVTTTTFYAYLGTETLYQNIVGSSSTDYVFAGGMRIAKISSTTVSYYHADGLGSTRLVTGSSGSVLFADNYQPFGQDNGTPTGSETYEFTGKPWSVAIGLYYDYQRWYDPSVGRFVSQDPLSGVLSNPQSMNPYAYAGNSPTVLTDPTGSSYEECGNTPCNGGTLGPGLWTMQDAQNYIDRYGITDTQLINECEQNPVICPDVLVRAGYDPLQPFPEWDYPTAYTGGDLPPLGSTEPIVTAAPDNGPVVSDLPATSGTETSTAAIETSPANPETGQAIEGGNIGYKFVGTPNGNLIRVPENWESRIANNGRGLVFQEPGAGGNSNMIRIMDPTARYPQGYVVYYNELGQPLDIYGYPSGPDATHIPLDYEGPIPGWP